jgi:calcium-dependent protein kinase
MQFDYPEKKWMNISKGAKDLINHMIAPENERYNAKQVLAHPWLQNANKYNLINLNFDPVFFKDYAQSNLIKKMALLFIASRLEQNEIQDLKRIFGAFDKEKNGQISFEELKQGLLQVRPNCSDDKGIFELFKSIDVDKNGKIDYTEFLASTLQKKSYMRIERLYEAFCLFDKDGSGKITKEEIMQVLKLEKTQEKEVEKIINLADKDKDGVIDYKEFLELMGYDDQ